MYNLEIITDNNNLAVSLDELKLHCRINSGNAENDLLTACIKTATFLFEQYTNLSVLQRTYKQWVDTFDGVIYFAKSPVTSITSVHFYDEDDDLTAFTNYTTDLKSLPQKIYWSDSVSVSSYRSPVANVQFVCGYTTIPEPMKVGIKLLAANFYRNREAHTEKKLNELPLGFQALVNQYKMNLQGTWGM